MKKISPQEARCLHFLWMGMRYREIASLIEVSPRTVESYISNLKRKLGIYTRSGLVEFYIEFLESKKAG